MISIFVYNNSLSIRAMFLFVIYKDFNLLMRSPKFLMSTELIVLRKEVKIFAIPFANLWDVLFILDTMGHVGVPGLWFLGRP